MLGHTAEVVIIHEIASERKSKKVQRVWKSMPRLWQVSERKEKRFFFNRKSKNYTLLNYSEKQIKFRKVTAPWRGDSEKAKYMICLKG